MNRIPSMTAATRKAVFEHLLELSARQSSWEPLEAAHVFGQAWLRLHLLSHWRMLRLAVRQGDGKEVAGQLFRLGLAPLGHISGRLPLGNPGRSDVGAFQPMPVRPDLERLIAQARALAEKPATGAA